VVYLYVHRYWKRQKHGTHTIPPARGATPGLTQADGIA
jgi:hypothetical protein